jgi:hypothetical protein
MVYLSLAYAIASWLTHDVPVKAEAILEKVKAEAILEN